MEEQKVEMNDAAKSVNAFLTKNKGILVAVCVVLVVVIAAWSVIATVSKSTTEKNLDAVEAVNYSLVKDSSLEGDELAEKQNKALETLKEYQSKSGSAGVRANLLAADILFAQKKYKESKDAWIAAAKGGKSYVSSIAYFNAAVCCEEVEDIDGAIANYENASKGEEFLFVTHALFSLGRVYEEKGDYKKACETYTKLFDKEPSDSWALLAKDRLITLKASGKIE